MNHPTTSLNAHGVMSFLARSDRSGMVAIGVLRTAAPYLTPSKWFYFGCMLGSRPGTWGGGITEVSPVLGVGAVIPELTSGGQMTPALLWSCSSVLLDRS